MYDMICQKRGLSLWIFCFCCRGKKYILIWVPSYNCGNIMVYRGRRARRLSRKAEEYIKHQALCYNIIILFSKVSVVVFALRTWLPAFIDLSLTTEMSMFDAVPRAAQINCITATVCSPYIFPFGITNIFNKFKFLTTLSL